MAYIDGAMKVHGPGLNGYVQQPPISISLNASDVSRSGDVISCTISATLNALSGYNRFGYSVNVFAQLDEGNVVQLISKPNYPDQWGGGTYGTGVQTISSNNSSTGCTLKIYMESSCPCNGGNRVLLYGIAMSAPPSVITYTVTFDANGGSEPPAPQTKYSNAPLVLNTVGPTYGRPVTISYNATGGSVNPSSSIGRLSFLRWNTSPDGSGTSYNPGSIYNENKDITLYAQFGTASVSLPIPTRNLCNFIGWYTDPDGGYKINSPLVTSSPMTLYARWNYRIVYDVNGGQADGGIPEQVKSHNKSIKLTSAKPYKTGGNFLGWSTSPTGSVKYKPGQTYTSNNPLHLYAIYDTPYYTVTFDLRGGSSTGGSLVQQVPYGGSASLPSDPIKQDYVFKGWVGQYTGITSNTTIYALWNGSPIWIKKSDGNWHSLVE